MKFGVGAPFCWISTQWDLPPARDSESGTRAKMVVSITEGGANMKALRRENLSVIFDRRGREGTAGSSTHPHFDHRLDANEPLIDLSHVLGEMPHIFGQ